MITRTPFKEGVRHYAGNGILRQKDTVMIDKKKATALFLEKLQAWETSQVSQTSGYEYERSYDAFVKSLFQESVGPLSRDRNRVANRQKKGNE